MRFSLFFSALTLAALSGCTTPGEPGEEQPVATACTEPRPQICTMIFAPVCAAMNDGTFETHASACNACANDQVAAYLPGPCEEQGTVQ